MGCWRHRRRTVRTGGARPTRTYRSWSSRRAWPDTDARPAMPVRSRTSRFSRPFATAQMREQAMGVTRRTLSVTTLGLLPIAWKTLGVPGPQPPLDFVVGSPGDVHNLRGHGMWSQGLCAWRARLRSAMSTQGTVTSEHGVGLFELAGMAKELSPVVLGLHAAIKGALD